MPAKKSKTAGKIAKRNKALLPQKPRQPRPTASTLPPRIREILARTKKARAETDAFTRGVDMSSSAHLPVMTVHGCPRATKRGRSKRQ